MNVPFYVFSAMAIDVTDSGKILIAGGDNNGVVLEEFNSDGTLNSSFGSGGIAASAGLGNQYSALSLTTLSNGNILVAGGGTEGFLTEYNADGSLHTAFGTNGTVLASAVLYWQSLTVLSDGTILAVGIGADEIILADYNTDGSLNTSFGSGGVTTYQFYGVFDAVTLRVLPTTGQIQIGAMSWYNSGVYLIAAQFTSSGQLDLGYGSGGSYQMPFNGNPWAMTADADGNLVVVGDAGGHVFVADYPTAT